MADRKQFLPTPETDKELQALLDEAKTVEVSEDEFKEQRISFAFGNAPESDLITKDSVRHSSAHIRIKHKNV